jgi:hypothetical protein
MLENDYLMRMILLFVKFLRQALGQRHKDPRTSAMELEQNIADTVDIDANLFFSLAPESMVTLLQLGDFDARLAEFMVRAMALDVEFLEAAGLKQSAELRNAQLVALANAYYLEISAADLTVAAIEEFIQEQDELHSM